MEPRRHLQILRAEGERIAALPADALAAPIPTLAGWDVERLVRHVGKVHQWCASFVRLAPGADLGSTGELPGIPKGPDCLPAYGEALEDLIAAFEATDPSRPCETFAGTADVAWWMRRQAHEVQVHRIDGTDAVAAAGGPASVLPDADGAADGIDEWARFFLATRWPQRRAADPSVAGLPPGLAGRTIHVHGTDSPADLAGPDGGDPVGAEWLLAFGEDGVEVEATHAKGDVALRGPAALLFLALWRRRPLGDLDVIGDAAVAEDLLDAARF